MKVNIITKARMGYMLNEVVIPIGIIVVLLIIFIFGMKSGPIQWEDKDNLIVEVSDSKGLNGLYRLVPVSKNVTYPSAESESSDNK